MHQIKVKLKHSSYSTVGYNCSFPVVGEDEAYFYSENDGVYRKHVFTPNDAYIKLVDKHEYVTATAEDGLEENEEETPAIEENVTDVEENEEPELQIDSFVIPDEIMVTIEKKESKKEPKVVKKPGRNKKNA